MTFGDMLKLTERLNQIKGAAQILIDERLNNMLNDVVLAYDSSDVHARMMYLAILDEMEV